MKKWTKPGLPAILILAGVCCSGRGSSSSPPGRETEGKTAVETKTRPDALVAFEVLRRGFRAKREHYDEIHGKLEGFGLSLDGVREGRKGMEREIEGNLESLKRSLSARAGKSPLTEREIRELAEVEALMTGYESVDDRYWKIFKAHVEKETCEKGMEEILEDYLRKKSKKD